MDTPFIGLIQLFPYTFAPSGWILCNGAVLNIQQYSALFALIGTQFGGNGQSTFAVPDLRNASPIPGVNYYISLYGIFPTHE